MRRHRPSRAPTVPAPSHGATPRNPGSGRFPGSAWFAKAIGRGWLWWLPSIVLVLFLAAAAGFVWLSHRYEAARQQEQQIADTLWVEQAIRFQISRDDEALLSLGRDISDGKVDHASFRDRAEQLLRTSRELGRVAWFDRDGRLVDAVATSATPTKATPPDPVTMAKRIAPGAFLYALPPSDEGEHAGPASLDLYARLRAPGDGMLVASFSLDALLAEMVPWWFAQDNEMQLSDAFGATLASRAPAGRGQNVYTHTTQLDLPGTTLYLKTDSVRDRAALLPNMLGAVVLLLSATLLASLWALRRDVMRRTDAEKRLRAEHAFRKAMEDSLVTGLRARDLDGRVTYVNPAFCKIVGYAADDLLGRVPPLPYWSPDAIEEHQLRHAMVLAGNAPAHGYETVFVHRGGARIQVLIYEAPLIDETGAHTGWMSSVLDVTERRRIEELYRQQQEKLVSGARLATMGEIASTLSHELNQPLAAITSYAAGCLNLLGAKAGPNRRIDAELADAIGKMQAQAERAGRVIKSVHDLLKKREPARAPCELAALVANTVPLIELQAKKSGVAIETRLPGAPVWLSADHIMIEQVLLNLTRNAIEAMRDVAPGRRHITIAAQLTRVGAMEAAGTPDQMPDSAAGAGVEISVADRGPGIADATRAQLFTPFFSTKAEGMGMGLAICRSAIEFHGGHLDHRPREGGGAVFVFTLPVISWPRIAGTALADAASAL